MLTGTGIAIGITYEKNQICNHFVLTAGCQLDFVNKKVFLKGSVFKKKKKVFNARKKVFFTACILKIKTVRDSKSGCQ